MQAEIAAGNQILLFLNRRGYAPVLTCHACGWVGGCPHCDARLTLHLDRDVSGVITAAGRARCRAAAPTVRAMICGCSAVAPSDWRRICAPSSQAPGSPASTVTAPDARASWPGCSTRCRRGEVQILLGTQMLAKGHDFPGVTLVGILELDQSLYASDFRAAGTHRAAHRAGRRARRTRRAPRTGRAANPPSGASAAPITAAGRLCRVRDAGLGGATRRRAAALHPSRAGARRGAGGGRSARLSAQARALARSSSASLACSCLDPVPAPMERRAGRYRAQLLAQCAERPRLQHFLGHWSLALRALPRRKGLRWSLDVDPQDML